MRQHGPWQILSTERVYRDPWIEVERDDVLRPDGAPGSHVVVRLKPGVSVLAIDASDRVYLTEEFHYGIGREAIEVVSGGIEPGEDAELTARRELAEELGITAGRWTLVGSTDPFTTVVVSPTRLYLAEDLSFSQTAQEGTERIRLKCLPLAEAVAGVLDGTITHAPSCILLLRAWLLRGGGAALRLG